MSSEELEAKNRKRRERAAMARQKKAEARADASALGVVGAVEAPIHTMDELKQDETKLATEAAVEAAVVAGAAEEVVSI
jgi:flagellar motor component MotA